MLAGQRRITRDFDEVNDWDVWVDCNRMMDREIGYR